MCKIWRCLFNLIFLKIWKNGLTILVLDNVENFPHTCVGFHSYYNYKINYDLQQNLTRYRLQKYKWTSRAIVYLELQAQNRLTVHSDAMWKIILQFKIRSFEILSSVLSHAVHFHFVQESTDFLLGLISWKFLKQYGYSERLKRNDLELRYEIIFLKPSPIEL